MTTTIKIASLILLGASLAALTGCDKQKPSATTASTNDTSIPKKIFLSERPADAPMLREVKASSQVGDKVVFEARVGGRMKPFVEGLAVFVTADPRLISCDQRPGDNCAYPYDYCCEDGDALKAGTATVQILDSDGTPYPVSAQGQGGIEPLKTIIVEGTVAEKDAKGVFVVDATNIWVGTIPTKPAGSAANQEEG